MKKPAKQNTAASVAVLIVTAVGVCALIGYSVWRNTRPLPPPVPVDMRPVEYEPTVTEITNGDETTYVNEARYALHGATIYEAVDAFNTVEVEAAYGKLNIEEIGIVSNNSDLSRDLSANSDWSSTYGDYDLSKCLYVRYMTLDYTSPDETPAFPTLVVSTLEKINGYYVSRQTAGTFCYDDEGNLSCERTELQAGLTFYAIIPLQSADDEGNLIDISDVSSDLVLRLSSFGSMNVTFEWLLGDSAIELITSQNQQRQEEVEANMTLATSDNQPAASVPGI